MTDNDNCTRVQGLPLTFLPPGHHGGNSPGLPEPGEVT